MTEQSCPFCEIAKSREGIIESNRAVFVVADTAPKAEHHVLVVPFRHVESLDAAPIEAVLALFAKARTVGAELGSAHGGYRLIVNVGEGGKQKVPHLHVHVLAGPEVVEPGFARSVH